MTFTMSDAADVVVVVDTAGVAGAGGIRGVVAHASIRTATRPPARRKHACKRRLVTNNRIC